MLGDETVVGFVGVEGFHHVVAVAPGLRAVFVGAVAVGLGVADEVEPVARPLLAVARAGEEFVHELLVSVGGLVGEELVQLEGRRGEAREVEVNATRKRGAIGGGGGLELGGGELLEDEGVYRIADCRLPIADWGDGGFPHRHERPPLFVFVRDFPAPHDLLPALRHWRTEFHPFLERGDLVGAELLVLRRHLEVRVGVADGFDEQAFLHVARHDGGAGVAALEDGGGGIQREAALELLRLMAVALEARAREDGLHRLLVEREVGGGGLGRGGVAGDGGEKRGGQQRGGGESEQVHRV